MRCLENGKAESGICKNLVCDVMFGSSRKVPAVELDRTNFAHQEFPWVMAMELDLPVLFRGPFAESTNPHAADRCLLPFALSKNTSLRPRGSARFPTPPNWHG